MPLPPALLNRPKLGVKELVGRKGMPNELPGPPPPKKGVRSSLCLWWRWPGLSRLFRWLLLL